MTKRIDSIDVARGIAIICIILGHLGIYNINRVVFTFHVPIFFLISGYFINDKQNVISFIKKRFRTLIVPYYFTCLVMIIVATIMSWYYNGTTTIIQTIKDWLIASLYGAGDAHTFLNYNIKAIGAIWFLWASFWGSVFLRISLKFNSMIRCIFVFILFILGVHFRNLIWLPFSIQPGCCALFYMYIGYSFRKQKANIINFSNEFKLLLIISSFIIVAAFIKNYETFWLVNASIGRGIIDVIGSLCACLIILLISNWISNNLRYLNTGLKFLGKYSLFMLCIHIIELNTFRWSEWISIYVYSGSSTNVLLALTIIGKLTFDIVVTMICANSVNIKKIFGIKFV